MQINLNAVECLNQFKNKKKFQEQDGPTFYPGLSKPNLLPIVSEIINQSADDFLKVAQSDGSEEEFRKQIQAGLKRFDPVHLELDTEDRERVCAYYEELMDCVGLDSSDGILNNWMYDFDPND